MQAIERARLEDLLAQYWEIAFDESSGVTPTGNKANRVLHEIRALFNKLEAENQRLRTESEERLQNCAALIAENERLRKDAERIDYIEESGNFGVFRYRSGSKGPVLIEAEDGKKDINKSASTLRDAIDAVMKDAK